MKKRLMFIMLVSLFMLTGCDFDFSKDDLDDALDQFEGNLYYENQIKDFENETEQSKEEIAEVLNTHLNFFKSMDENLGVEDSSYVETKNHDEFVTSDKDITEDKYFNSRAITELFAVIMPLFENESEYKEGELISSDEVTLLDDEDGLQYQELSFVMEGQKLKIEYKLLLQGEDGSDSVTNSLIASIFLDTIDEKLYSDIYISIETSESNSEGEEIVEDTFEYFNVYEDHFFTRAFKDGNDNLRLHLENHLDGNVYRYYIRESNSVDFNYFDYEAQARGSYTFNGVEDTVSSKEVTLYDKNRSAVKLSTDNDGYVVELDMVTYDGWTSFKEDIDYSVDSLTFVTDSGTEEVMEGTFIYNKYHGGTLTHKFHTENFPTERELLIVRSPFKAPFTNVEVTTAYDNLEGYHKMISELMGMDFSSETVIDDYLAKFTSHMMKNHNHATFTDEHISK